MRLAMDEANHSNVARSERGWRLFLLSPRLLLHRPPGGGHIPKSKLAHRFNDFVAVAVHRKRMRECQAGDGETGHTQETLDSFRDRRRRPPLPRGPIPRDTLEHQPDNPFKFWSTSS